MHETIIDRLEESKRFLVDRIDIYQIRELTEPMYLKILCHQLDTISMIENTLCILHRFASIGWEDLIEEARNNTLADLGVEEVIEQERAFYTMLNQETRNLSKCPGITNDECSSRAIEDLHDKLRLETQEAIANFLDMRNMWLETVSAICKIKIVLH